MGWVVAILYVAMPSVMSSEIRNQYQRDRQANNISEMFIGMPASACFIILLVSFAMAKYVVYMLYSFLDIFGGL